MKLEILQRSCVAETALAQCHLELPSARAWTVNLSACQRRPFSSTPPATPSCLTRKHRQGKFLFFFFFSVTYLGTYELAQAYRPILSSRHGHLSWIPPGTYTCAVLPSCEGCAFAVLFTLPKPDQVLLPCICHFRPVLPEHSALVLITYFHPAVLSLASYHLPNRNVKPNNQRADGVFDPVFQAVPGALKLPNKHLFSGEVDCRAQEIRTHIHHGTVATKGIYVVSPFLRDSTDVGEKSKESSRQFRNGSNIPMRHPTLSGAELWKCKRETPIGGVRFHLHLQVISQRQEEKWEAIPSKWWVAWALPGCSQDSNFPQVPGAPGSIQHVLPYTQALLCTAKGGKEKDAKTSPQSSCGVSALNGL